MTLTLTAALLLSGCRDDAKETPTGQAVEIVAGGGTNLNAAKSLDAMIMGSVRDVEVSRDGVVRLLTNNSPGGVTIWVFRPDGRTQRIAVDPQIRSASQLAVGNDGTMYIAHSNGPAGQVSKVTAAGKVLRIVGDGKEGFTADGGSALGAASPIEGVAVDREGRLVYGELRYYSAEKQNLGVIRRVGADGRIATIAGTSGPLPGSKYSEMIAASVAPPAGTKALQWSLPGVLQLRSLVVDGDGVIFAQSERGVLRFPADGTVRSVVRRRDADAAPVGQRPFANEGDAADADPRFQTSAGIAVDGGHVAMPVTIARPEDAQQQPAAFRWLGDYSPGQRSLVDNAAHRAVGQSLQEIVRLARPDGSVTTAAWSVQGAALGDGWLYLVTSADDQLLVGRIKLPA
ncbi:hypothetical protein [Kribbella catacumbae]|uniref:hypothetical protein n=1 Tax=Kribbella catacumbae TaxID=460086 RepID=UPI00037F5825|nr:hypothetical protein [Kribbella catacumbae]